MRSFPLRTSTWISIAAIAATLVVAWAIYSHRGNVRQTLQHLDDEPTIEVKPKATREPKGQPSEVSLPSARIACSLEEAKEAGVKFEMPLGIGHLMQYGTGFLIDKRGWIATNNHVLARITKDARVKLADGKRRELAGLVARAPQYDLAIVKLKEPPANLTVLDVH
jgi:S1-C subfamily serine protease